jgi:repressor LexA
MSERPTKCQQVVVDAIRELTRLRGYPPTLREIGTAVGTLPTDVHQKLERLRKIGYVEWEPKQFRTLRVVK